MSKTPAEQMQQMAELQAELERLYKAISDKNEVIEKLNSELSTAKSSSADYENLKTKINDVYRKINVAIVDGGKKKKRSRSRKRKY